MDIVDDAWRKDKLPEEDIAVPLSELPDPESDNGESYLENFGISKFSFNHLKMCTLGCKMFGPGGFWLETRVIIKNFYPSLVTNKL